MNEIGVNIDYSKLAWRINNDFYIDKMLVADQAFKIEIERARLIDQSYVPNIDNPIATHVMLATSASAHVVATYHKLLDLIRLELKIDLQRIEGIDFKKLEEEMTVIFGEGRQLKLVQDAKVLIDKENNPGPVERFMRKFKK